MGETAARLNCERETLTRVLSGKAGVSAKMALALKGMDWRLPTTGCVCRSLRVGASASAEEGQKA